MKNRDHTINERNRTDIMSQSPAQPSSAGRPIDPHKDQAILSAARDLLFQHGLQAVSIEAVAKKAGVSKVTVYSRHANRDDLICAIIRSQAETFSAHLPLPQTSLAGVRTALLNFSLSVLEFLVSPEHLQFIRVVAASSNVPEPILQDIFTQGARNTLQQLEQWLTALQQSGLLQCENPVRSAEALVGMLLRLDIVRNLYGVSVDNSEVELQAHARFVVDGFIRMHRG